MLTPDLDTVRLFVHVLAAAVWVGGQFVLAGVVPGLRKIGPEATKAAANGFAKVAWPAFAIAVVTGVWNLMVLPSDLPSGYHATLGVKILLAMVSGGAAAVHSTTGKKAVLAATGALGAIAAVAVLFFGVLIGHL